MLGTLIVGLGRSGRELHLPVLLRARASAAAAELFAAGPVVVCDPYRGDEPIAGTLRAGSLPQAAGIVDPATTVVHLCTPPTARLEAIGELAELGFRKLIIEKPLAVDDRSLAGIVAARRRWGLDVVVVAPWLASVLTRRIRELLATRELGRLRAIDIVQRKPRYLRSLTLADDHPSAFDIEVPHAIAVALALAGGASVVDAAATDMVIDDVVMLRKGGASLTLQHHSGVRTRIRSDLMAMVRERRIELQCDGATIVGHYPASAADDAAQMIVTTDSEVRRSVFRHDDLMSVVVEAYERFHTRVTFDLDLVLQAEVVRLLAAAKCMSERSRPSLSLSSEAAVGRQRAS